MTEIARDSLLVLAVIMLAGGVMGFVKAKSKPSLIAGVASGVLLVACFVVALSNLHAGLIGGCVIAVLLIGVFIKRLLKTKKLMPAVPIMVANLIVLGLLIAALVQGG